jgi:hypothetical protein
VEPDRVDSQGRVGQLRKRGEISDQLILVPGGILGQRVADQVVVIQFSGTTILSPPRL